MSAVEAALEVLFEGRGWVAVRKPVGWLTTGPRAGRVAGVLVEQLARQLRRARGAPLPHPLSRLDVDVSGVVLFALDARALAAANEARRAGSYARGYRALVSPAPSAGVDEGAWAWPVGLDPRDPRRRTATAPREPQPARSSFRVLARGAYAAAELALEPHTGRTHQLRVHAQRAGHPVLGDPLYGGLRNVPGPAGAVLAARRTMLHAAWVRVPEGPVVECAPPDDYAELRAALCVG